MSIVAEKKEKRYVSDNAQLMSEWDWEKNSELQFDPTKLTCGSGRKAWWKCANGHEWQAKIANRANGIGCPYCAGRYAVAGKNDLTTSNPSLAREWNHERNGELTPQNVTANSGKNVWWKCSKGHEWKAKIYSRHIGNGCPICNSERHTSLPEYALIYYLEEHGIEVIHSYKGLGYELDIYIPSKKTKRIWKKTQSAKKTELNYTG